MNPDKTNIYVPEEFYDWAKASVLAAHFAEEVACLSSDVSIIDIDLCNALGDAAYWLEAFASTSEGEAHYCFDGDVRAGVSVFNGDTLATLVQLTDDIGQAAYHLEIAHIKEISALANQAEALLADNQQQIAA